MNHNPARQALNRALTVHNRHAEMLIRPATDILTELLTNIPHLPVPDVYPKHDSCAIQWTKVGVYHRPLVVTADSQGTIRLTLIDRNGGPATVCETTGTTPGWLNIARAFVNTALQPAAEPEKEPALVVRFNSELLRQLADAYTDPADTAAEQARLALLPQADAGCPHCAHRCNDSDCQPGTDCGSQCNCNGN